jgi:hypothetical protein
MVYVWGKNKYTFKTFIINHLTTKYISIIWGISRYRAVNTLNLGYKNQTLHVV